MYRVALVLTLALASACAGRSSYRVTAAASSGSADLVYVRPGVYAVANANAPVFYANDHYWLYADGGWYRSQYLHGGWHYAQAPYALLQIERPRAYVRYSRYRPERRVYVDVRDRRDYRERPRVIQRDHRARDRRDIRDHRDHRDRRR